MIDRMIKECDVEIERLEEELIRVMVQQTHVKKFQKTLKKLAGKKK